ncbi:hemolysin family protein [Flaviaesturariibacter amylovorans]|uniref:Hemolysin family protein n=1 Tax=Flaviaesturariibacter amylovorans TaxID=1084520 RepID=A0ABP8HPI3_9BACT
MIASSVIIWFFVSLLMMAFFSGLEMAFYSVNRFGVELKKKQGRPGAHTLARFIQSPETFVSVMLLGFTVCLVYFVLLFGAVTEPIWRLTGLGHEKYDSVRLFLDIILATFLVLVLGEFIPKAFFRAKSNVLLSRLVWLISPFYWLLQPLATAFIGLSNWVLKYVFSVRFDEKKGLFRSTDFDTLFQQSNSDEYEPEDVNTELFENALELPKTKIRQCLVPRKEIIAVDIRASVEEVRNKLVDTKLSKLVVFEGNIDHIVGYVHQLDLFKNPVTVQEILLPIPAVPESMSATDLINKFTREGKSIAWVVDEFGGTAGIVTMEDVLEEIFGEIQDEYDMEEFVEKRLAENEYMFSGRLELDYLCDKYELSFPEDEESETLSGYIINHHETIPKQKERIIIGNYEFDILNVGDTRIEMVKLKILK